MQVERRAGKVRRPKTDVLLPCHATKFGIEVRVRVKVNVGEFFYIKLVVTRSKMSERTFRNMSYTTPTAYCVFYIVCFYYNLGLLLIFYMYICRILLIQLFGCHIEINACLVVT